MITSLEINNFLSHKHSEFTFANGVNVLVGLSDSGKSAIMNALQWVIKNEPSGDSFRSWWGGATSVKIVIDNTYEITRIRNEKENGYVLLDLTKNEPESHFNAIKNGVPEEIADILNIDETNIQTQLASHFLLSNTPGEVAKHFNKVSKFDKIDFANSNINSWINSLNQDIKYKETELQKNTDTLSNFNYLEKVEIEVEVLENMQEQLANKQNQAKKLSVICSALKKVQIEVNEYEELLQIETSINEIIQNIEKQKKLELKQKQLKELYRTINKTLFEIQKNEKLIPAGKTIDTLLVLFKKYDSLLSEKNKLQRAINNIKITDEMFETSKKNYDKLHEEFKDNMPKICPLCNQTIKK
jgi:DNA repair protein SbcC/Rad50